MTGSLPRTAFAAMCRPQVKNQFDAARLEETEEEAEGEESDADAGTSVSVVADAAVAR